MNDSERGTDEISVVDVYDIASEIGKECERIIDRYGAETVTALMPKVINALELLEHLATRNERENVQLDDLNTKIAQLETDKIEKAEYRDKFEKELEIIDDQWRSETKELLSLVTRLQDENRRLLKEQNIVTKDTQAMTPSPDFSDGMMLQKLQMMLDKQRDELRQKEHLLQDKCCDIDGLRSQIDRLGSNSRELRRKHKSLQNQVRNLCDERADFLIQMQEQQRDIGMLRDRLGLAQKENEDLTKCDIKYPSNKAVYDLDDPNRPRFTTAELKEILNERNDLKTKVCDLEEELEHYRPKPRKNKTDTKQHHNSNVNIEAACDSFVYLNPTDQNPFGMHRIDETDEIEEADEDAPVQGPLPYEPDDAPWKKSNESGIRKFFRKLFSETITSAGDVGDQSSPSHTDPNQFCGDSSNFPRRSLSTLRKMALSTSRGMLTATGATSGAVLAHNAAAVDAIYTNVTTDLAKR